MVGMRLFFDARYIRTDFHDGISRYTTELGNALASLTPVTFIICDDKQRKFLPKDAACIMLHAPTSPKEPFTSMLLNKHRPDVVVSPLQTMGSIGRKFKLILTLHDVFYYKFPTPPQQFNSLIRLGWRLYHLTPWPGRMVLNRADIVATVSQTSKMEIESMKLTRRPVIVVSNAARDLSVYLKKRVGLKKSAPKNLVYMGAFLPYKNVETLVRMMHYLPDRTLHLCSRISPRRKAQLETLASPTAKIVFHDGVSDEQYAKLLANDALMVSASKAEGYGLPLAEALALGVPAVISDIAIFHEVAGEGAHYADPDNPSDFAKKIIDMDSLDTREKYVKAGKRHIDKFSWKESAGTLLSAATKLSEQSLN